MPTDEIDVNLNKLQEFIDCNDDESIKRLLLSLAFIGSQLDKLENPEISHSGQTDASKHRSTIDKFEESLEPVA